MRARLLQFETHDVASFLLRKRPRLVASQAVRRFEMTIEEASPIPLNFVFFLYPPQDSDIEKVDYNLFLFVLHGFLPLASLKHATINN